jgi:hypothetical protein
VHTEKKQNRENCRISKTPYWVVAIMVWNFRLLWLSGQFCISTYCMNKLD